MKCLTNSMFQLSNLEQLYPISKLDTYNTILNIIYDSPINAC